MCGIAGIFGLSAAHGLDLEDTARGMARTLKHRGPDDEGVWADVDMGVSLAHRRLAILDLTEAGHQPMLSSCERYVLVFNGEIYNHHAIRRDLEKDFRVQGGSRWRGHSDTETLLYAISHWGLDVALERSVGMFALALWDRFDKALYLARDRIGEKPLHYCLHQGSLLFASELKAIRSFPRFQSEIDRNALAQFLRFNAIPAPNTIYVGIFKLPPGTILKVTEDNISHRCLVQPRPYWSLFNVASLGQTNLAQGNTKDLKDELERLLKQSISDQLLADVPVGAFLSGGIDSSTVVALMQAESATPIKTYTIGFQEGSFDEAHDARAVAKHLGTDHTELYVTARQALAVIPRLPALYDEPFADASQIPTYLVSELAQRDVKVCLSGDGGDELFGGYNRYINGARLWRAGAVFPEIVGASFAVMLRAFQTGKLERLLDQVMLSFPRRRRINSLGQKMQRAADVLTARSAQDAYLQMVSNWSYPEKVVIGADLNNEQRISCFPDTTSLGLENQMMLVDSLSFLPDDILVKLDRAAMGVSLETRVPMLDHRIVEFAWRLPIQMKIRGNQGKWLLRQVLNQYVPRALVDRPKAGFSVPINSWLRGPLKDWAEDLISMTRLKNDGFFVPETIRHKWEEHLAGKRDWSGELWGVLMFQAWLDQAEI